jgi:hypothetical protein
MGARQLELLAKPPRKRRRVLMHLIDAGNLPNGGKGVHFKCGRCGHDGGWWQVDTVTEAKRGEPCPKCNKSQE